MMRWVIGVLSLLLLLAMPSAVFAVDGLPSAFYVFMNTGDKRELVKVQWKDPFQLTKIAELSWSVELPLTIENGMPETEKQAFAEDGYPEWAVDKKIRMTDSRLWVIDTNRFLISRVYDVCSEMMDNVCYGYNELILFEASKQTEHVLWMLPYHARPNRLSGGACYGATGFNIFSQVEFHPTQDLVALIVGGCEKSLLLVDYSLSTPQPYNREFDQIMAVSWSPDGTELAYIDQQACEALLCNYEFGTMTLEDGQKQPFQRLNRDWDEGFWIVWFDQNTIIYSRPSEKGQDVFKDEAITWHDLSHNSEISVTLPLPQLPLEVFHVVGDSGSVIYSNTLINGDTPGWNTIITENPLAIESQMNRISISRSRNQRYALVSLYSPCERYYCAPTGFGFIDSEQNIYLVDLEIYRQEYGADSINFVGFGP